MFTNNNDSVKKSIPSSAAINMIGDGTTITGDIKSKGDIRVDGSLKGSIETEGKVVVGQGGVVEGDVVCKDADVAGVLKAKITVIQNSVRGIEKNVRKELKSLERKLNKNKNKGSRKPSGFAVPSSISNELCSFMKLNQGAKIARTEVTQYIINYIKQKELQDKNNGRKIKPDKALKSLLNVKKNEDLTYFNLQKYMNKHFVKEA